jgi:hypothetical protein
MNRRNLMVMTGFAALAAAAPPPLAVAEPNANPPGQPMGPPPPAGEPVNIIFADDFDGPAGSPPDLSKWTVVNWNEPVIPPILGLFRDDRRNVCLDGNGNLALRATQEDGTYYSGRVESTMKIGIGHTWEARIKLNCLVPGCWPAYWLVNREPTPDGRGPLPDGEVDILEWYGNGKWAPGSSVHARSDGKTWKENRWPVDGDWPHVPASNGTTAGSGSGGTTSAARRTSPFPPCPLTGCGPSTHPTTCCTPS